MKELSKNTQAIIVLGLIIAAGLWACSGPDGQTPASASEDAAPKERVASRLEVNEQPTAVSVPGNLAEAIERYRGGMSDTTNTLSPGAGALAIWALENGMSWKELEAIPSTKAGLVRKDASEERGKRICATGSIIEIAADVAGGKKAYQGGLGTYSGDIYRFIVVGSTGDLMERSAATLCGVVIGTVDYSNSAGGATHAVQLVGMFKLPENVQQ